MDVILHLGAHRTASTTFQAYMRANAAQLAGQGIGFWGPLRTRSGLLDGILPVPGRRDPSRTLDRATGRLAMRCDRLARASTRALIVSDENLIGTMHCNLAHHSLYHSAGERLARYHQAFGGRVTRVVLSIRSLEQYWASALAYTAARGHGFADSATLDRLVTRNRGWRDVITDVRCSFPDAELNVDTFESMGARPDARLAAMLGGTIRPPMRAARDWLNRAPDLARLNEIAADCGLTPETLPRGRGRWHPFDANQSAALREAYLDDLFWLRAGADGLATLTDETGTDQAGKHLPLVPAARGSDHDGETRRLARAR